MPGTAFPPWCVPDGCPASICGGPHVRWSTADGTQEATVPEGQDPPPGFTLRVPEQLPAQYQQAAARARELQEEINRLGAGKPQAHPEPQPPAASALEVLDIALAAAREHKRLGDSVSHADTATASEHYLAGILGLAIAVASVIQEEAS